MVFYQIFNYSFLERKALYRWLDRYIGIILLFILTLFFKRKRTIPTGNIQNILLVKFAAIGDVLIMIPMLRLLKKTYPGVTITFACTDIDYDMVKRIKYVDRIINYNIYNFLTRPFELIKYIKEVRDTEYDIIIDAEQWSRIDPILCIFFKKRYTIGFRTKKQFKHIYFDSTTEFSRNRHAIDSFFALLEFIGITAEESDKILEYDLAEEHLGFAEKFWNENKLHSKYVICFQPSVGTNNFAREWKPEYFIELGRLLVNYSDKIFILITGIKKDYLKGEIIAKGIGKNVINIAGKFSFDQDMAIIKRSDLMICGNTGILHLAASVGTKTIGLHGPNNPEIWGAYDPNAVVIKSDIYCSPCLFIGHDFGCKNPICMDKIKPDDVYITVRKILKEISFSPV